MASTAATPLSSSSPHLRKPNANTNKTAAPLSVSYEAFAPRSTSQVSRLSRIAALTAGPTARAAARTSTASTANKFLCQSVSVPCLLRPKNPDDHETMHQEAAALTHALLLQHKQHDKDKDDESKQPEDNDTNLVYNAVSHATDASRQLTHQWKHTTSLRLALRASVNIAQDISQAHAALIKHSGELSAQADLLQEEAEQLEAHAEELGTPLQHYNAVDRIGVQVGVLFKTTASSSHSQGRSASSSTTTTTVRGLAKLKVDADEFESTLKEIDAAILYFGQQAGGPEALEEHFGTLRRGSAKARALQQPQTSGHLEYYRRALVLQEAALFLVQEAVADRLTLTTQQVQNALQSQHGVVPADQLEASLIYTRFHGISNRSLRLIQLVKARLQALTQQNFAATSSDDAATAYSELLRTCRTTYCSCRERLLLPTVRGHLDALDKLHGPTGTTRLASVFLMRLCNVETQLYRDFFVGHAASDAASSSAQQDRALIKNPDLQGCLQTLCAALHRTVRRSLVSCTDLDTLTGIVSVLREEGSHAHAQAYALQTAKTLHSLVEDAQERVIFCANRTLQREVIRFKATPLDLDYPNKLVKLKEQQAKAKEQGQGTTEESKEKEEEGDDKDKDDKEQKPLLPSEPTTSTAASASSSSSSAQEQLNWVYESWFPPLRTVLRILSKIFRVVETRVFEDLALSSVQACTQALKDGAVFVKNTRTQTDADLFLVKHLLILREQLSPFDMELRTVERQLDFSEAGKAVAKFLANRNRRLLSMSTENAVLTLLREGVSVQESSVDSKRDLEEALRSACNDFIEHVVTATAGPLVALVQGNAAAGSGKLSNKDGPDKVMGVLKKTLEQIDQILPVVLDKMGLYLDNAATQSILLKPVTKKIHKATEELKTCIANTVDHHWNSEAARTQALELAQQVEPAVKKLIAQQGSGGGGGGALSSASKK